MAAESRWGRRKQKNPRRKDEGDSAVEHSMTEPDNQIEADATAETCHDSIIATNEGCHERMTPVSEGCRELSMDTTDSPGGLTRNEDSLSQESDMEQEPSVNGDKEIAANVSQMNGNASRSEDESTPEEEEKKEAEEKGVESEEDKIQELLNRSDTAVIFPEPVSDPEDSAPHGDETRQDEPGTGEKHACPQCGVTFVLKTQLEKHMALHSPTSQSCKICNKTFANVYRLQRHMISHEESSDLRKFKCTECGKAFKFKHHLKEHTRIHSGEKPFECPNCGKRFSHSGSYSSHMTSKKCWVVNLKMRGRGDKTPEKPDGILRPLVPKSGAGENKLDMTSPPVYSMYPQPFIPLDPSAAANLQSQFVAQMSGTRPFLPHVPFNVGQMINPLMPGMPVLPPGFPMPDMRELKNLHQKLMQQHMAQHKEVKESNNQESKENSKLDSTEKALDENQNRDIVQNRSSSLLSPASIKREDGQSNSDESPEARSLVNGDHREEGSESSKDGHSQTEEENHLHAVKKVLEIVGATVSQQQKNSEDKAALSRLASPPLPSPERTSSLNALAAAAEKMQQEMQQEQRRQDVKIEPKVGSSSLKCKFCQENFYSPIELHQHERYLCKENRDIQLNVSGEQHLRNGALTPSSISTDRTDEDHQEATSPLAGGEPRRCRGRSMINEEQQQLLKAFYATNPRPTKIDLERLAAQIGFPKRVVQVWFQNMRARDRRKGRQIPDGPLSNAPSTCTTSAYIPVVPQYSVPGSMFYNASPKTNGHPANAVSNGPTPSQNVSLSMQTEQPLDLSMKNDESPSALNLSKETNREGEAVLNLSLKDKSDVSLPATKVEESAIFKYMQQEGLFGADKASVSSGRPSPIPGQRATPPAINTTPAHSKSYASPMFERPHHDPAGLPPRSPSLLSSGFSPPPSSLDASFSSTHSLDSLDSKPKRARKKSWRQMESEELQMDFDESMEMEEDGIFRKKRRSWKHHKVDTGEGMYACDQCDKMFNKQSSLARHKYEHSGQRPFPCDICGKAFKHKHHLTEHKRLHSGEKPFICKKCGKRFSHSGSYSQHMNHRYKYCKPLRMGLESGALDSEENGDDEEFPGSMPEDASVPE